MSFGARLLIDESTSAGRQTKRFGSRHTLSREDSGRIRRRAVERFQTRRHTSKRQANLSLVVASLGYSFVVVVFAALLVITSHAGAHDDYEELQVASQILAPRVPARVSLFAEASPAPCRSCSGRSSSSSGPWRARGTKRPSAGAPSAAPTAWASPSARALGATPSLPHAHQVRSWHWQQQSREKST